MGPQSPQFGYYGEQKRKLPIKPIILVATIIIVLFVLVFTIAGILGRNSIGTQSQHLSVQLANLTTLTSSAAKQLKASDLQKINAETAIITDGVGANLAPTLPKKVDKSIQADESDASDTTRLSNAALDGTYDSTYKQVLQQKLESVSALLSDMYTKTKSTSLRAALNDDSQNYQALLKNLAKATL